MDLNTLVDDSIDIICKMSNRQVDPSLIPKLKALKGRENIKEELLETVIDPIINYSLASGFVLSVLQSLYEAMGGDIKDATGKVICEVIE